MFYDDGDRLIGDRNRSVVGIVNDERTRGVLRLAQHAPDVESWHAGARPDAHPGAATAGDQPARLQFVVGLVVSRDTPIQDFAARLRKHGVDVTEIVKTEAGDYISFTDPDGNPIYVGDWDPDFDEVPGESLEHRLARQENESAVAKG